MTTTGPITLTIDMRENVAKSREVIEELQRRLKQFSPEADEDYVLRSLLMEITFDYLEAKKKSTE
ncbi:hypothetical protein R2217_000747 [Cronobacter turicensis]|nr:hypothetical protein [Cronobacter turicensis]ELQ6074637.1 hypothetical protein [Cronobacter turicensis]ELQ6183777.1 hypothetical protein [Cronobacter turicensis]ELQ6234723.1 hypothetical protein [Cronobacter turicensis]ELQ6238603.1 hypothetical protein [Cronobacter turicensis]